MIIDKTTGKLPPNFIMLGILLMVIGIIGLFNGNFLALLFFLIALPILMLRSGLLLDIENKRIKKYSSFLWMKFGSWVDISKIEKLMIGEVRQNQGMSVLSISRDDINITYKLFAMKNGQRLEIVSGTYELVNSIAEHLSKNLQISVNQPKHVPTPK